MLSAIFSMLLKIKPWSSTIPVPDRIFSYDVFTYYLCYFLVYSDQLHFWIWICQTLPSLLQISNGKCQIINTLFYKHQNQIVVLTVTTAAILLILPVALPLLWHQDRAILTQVVSVLKPNQASYIFTWNLEGPCRCVYTKYNIVQGVPNGWTKK